MLCLFFWDPCVLLSIIFDAEIVNHSKFILNLNFICKYFHGIKISCLLNVLWCFLAILCSFRVVFNSLEFDMVNLG